MCILTHSLTSTVNIKLQHLFAEASEVTRLFAIEEGIGFGRVNVSLLFKPVKVELPPNLLGWETGTVEWVPIPRKKN